MSWSNFAEWHMGFRVQEGGEKEAQEVADKYSPKAKVEYMRASSELGANFELVGKGRRGVRFGVLGHESRGQLKLQHTERAVRCQSMPRVVDC